MKCALVKEEEEFNRILGNIIHDVLLDDPGETSTSGSPTTNRQVLVTLAVSEGNYGVIAYRIGLMPGANSHIMTNHGLRASSADRKMARISCP